MKRLPSTSNIRTAFARQSTRLIWTSTTSNPVITDGAPTHVDIALSQVPATQSAAPLEGTSWKLIALGGAPTGALPQEREAQIEFNAEGHRIAATGGCNRLLGSYQLHGESLSIAPAGMTMMACPEPLMAQERNFTDALRATKTYRIPVKRSNSAMATASWQVFALMQ